MQDKEFKESNQRRTALRFSVHDLYVSLDLSPNRNAAARTFLKARVCDASPEGCSILVNEDELNRQDFSYTTERLWYLTFSTTHNDADGPLSARLVYSKPPVNNSDNNLSRWGFLFESYVRPERLGPFTSLFVNPCEHYQSTQQRHKSQETLALHDLNALTNSITSLKMCQFQLMLASLPLFLGLFGTTFAIIEPQKGQVLPWWVPGLPFACVILSSALLLVFLQKSSSIRRELAFKMLLQRYLYLGSFPPCYRGWHDAYETYNHVVQHGCKTASIYHVKPLKERQFQKLPHLPGNAFTWFSYAFLGVIPTFSTILTYVLAHKYMDKETVSYIVTIALSSLVWSGIYYIFVRQLYELHMGKQTFRYMVIIFSKILKRGPLFDSYNNQPL